MAKKKEATVEVQSSKVKVKALESLVKFGFGYLEGMEFEINKELAEIWVESGSVEIL